RLLPSFDSSLSEAAKRALEQLGVEVRIGTAVTDCNAEGVSIGPERIGTRTILWAAGVKASPAAEWLGASAGRAEPGQVAPGLSRGMSVCADSAMCSCSATRLWRWIGREGLCRALLQLPSSKASTWPIYSWRARPEGNCRRSTTAISARWRRSGASERWPSSADSNSRALSPGFFGASLTSTFSLDFATVLLSR